MEESNQTDLKNIIQFNLVPKVEPNDDEYVLCGEFVDIVPSATTSPPPPLPNVDYRDPISIGYVGDNLLKLRDCKVVIKRWQQELKTDADVKVEPEENIYHDSGGKVEVDDPPIDEQVAVHQNEDSADTKHRFDSDLTQLTDDKTSRSIAATHMTPSIQMAAQSAAAELQLKLASVKKVPARTHWIYGLNKAKLTEELQKYGLPTEGTIDNLRKTMANFIKSNHQINGSNNTASATISEHLNSSNDDLQSKTNGPVWIHHVISANPPEAILPYPKKRKRVSYSYTEEVDGILWYCCDMQFESFSAYNDHKVQEHLIEELKCSFCMDRSFSSITEIEKHYLDVHVDSSWTSFHCLDCRLVFGVKSSFFDHKAKCSESWSVCTEILDSIIDFTVTRKKTEKVEVKENPTFRLSCCESIIDNFEDFAAHKLSQHNIAPLTCGLCLCVKGSIPQLRSHYQKSHFSKFWERLKLKLNKKQKETRKQEEQAKQEKEAASIQYSSTQEGSNWNKAEDGPIGQAKAKAVQCSAVQDGILCQCNDCTKLLDGSEPISDGSIALEKPFHCAQCNLGFNYKSRLRKHLRTHEGVKPFSCDICGSAFTAKISLKTHKLNLHSSITPQVLHSCGVCNKLFINKNSLKRHITNVHLSMNKDSQFKCEYCGKTYYYRSHLLAHINSIHIKDKEFICDHCNKIFYDKKWLVSHIQSLHLHVNETFECQKCGRTFKTKMRLSAHESNIHSDIQFTCELCGKALRSKQKLKLHMAGHSDETPFICQTCGKGFKRSINLSQHQYTHSDLRPHVCDICGKTFRLRTHVKQHMAVHGLIKNLECPICKKGFARKAELNSHLSTHG